MRALLCIPIIALSGCASVGNRVNHQYAQSIEKGVTTEQEIIAKMGQPMATAINSDEVKVLTYMHVDTQVHDATFIPIVGLFAGGADSTATTFIIKIDNETGIAQDWTYSTSTSTVKNGG